MTDRTERKKAEASTQNSQKPDNSYEGSFNLFVPDLDSSNDDNAGEHINKSEKWISFKKRENITLNNKQEISLSSLHDSAEFSEELSKSDSIDQLSERYGSSCPMVGFDWTGLIEIENHSKTNNSENKVAGKRRGRKAPGRSSTDLTTLAQMRASALEKKSKGRNTFKKSKSCENLNQMKDVLRSSHLKEKKKNKDAENSQNKDGKPSLGTSGARRPPSRSKSSNNVTKSSKATERRKSRRSKSGDDLASLRKSLSSGKSNSDLDRSLDGQAHQLMQDCQRLLEECQTLPVTNKLDDIEVVEDCEKLLKDCKFIFGETVKAPKTSKAGRRKLPSRSKSNDDLSLRKRELPVRSKSNNAKSVGQVRATYCFSDKSSLDNTQEAWDFDRDNDQMCSKIGETPKTLSRRSKLKNRENLVRGKTDERPPMPKRGLSSSSRLKKSASKRSRKSESIRALSNRSLLNNDIENESHSCQLDQFTKTCENNLLLGNNEDSDTGPDACSGVYSSDDDSDCNGDDIKEALQFSPENDIGNDIFTVATKIGKEASGEKNEPKNDSTQEESSCRKKDSEKHKKDNEKEGDKREAKDGAKRNDKKKNKGKDERKSEKKKQTKSSKNNSSEVKNILLYQSIKSDDNDCSSVDSGSTAQTGGTAQSKIKEKMGALVSISVTKSQELYQLGDKGMSKLQSRVRKELRSRAA